MIGRMVDEKGIRYMTKFKVVERVENASDDYMSLGERVV